MAEPEPKRLPTAPRPVQVLLLGKGTVGSEWLSQLAALKQERPLLVGVADRQRLAFEPRGLEPSRWAQALAVAPTRGAERVLDLLAALERPVLVDCTAADGMAALHAAALGRGIDVVSANKKPLVLPWKERRRLFDQAEAAGSRYRYETTVGAGLPVLEPLKDLLRTGDEIRRIEGSLSGTLGFVSGELLRGVKLSRAVEAARELGYTEPHPREDLSGADVARKALILAREAGLDVELRDVKLTPFVPEHVLAEDDPTLFLKGLATLDAEWGERAAQMARSGKLLRYLARIDVAERSVTVGPTWVDERHAAARLDGTEALVTIWSRRYSVQPLRIQGPGAGAAVTAAGVLAEVLALQRR